MHNTKKYEVKRMNCTHETIVKIYRATKRNPEYPYNLMKELVIRCKDCVEEDASLLHNAKEVIDLTEDELH